MKKEESLNQKHIDEEFKEETVKKANSKVDDNLNTEEISENKAESNLDAIKEEMEEDKEGVSIERFKTMYEEKCNELEELNNRYIRLQADFINYKRRAEKEKENLYTYTLEEIMKGLLPILDNFERALESINDKDDNYYKGIEMVYNQFIDVLKKMGLEEIDALGQRFDPTLHHGVAQEESDEHDEDTVIDVFQKGYKLKDKVIRPSMVKISK